MTLRLLPEAQQEIDEAFAYYEAQRLGLGGRFIGAIENGYDLIEAFPRAWLRARRNARWYMLKKFPFAIVYVVRSNDIVVIALSHVRRRRGYWVACDRGRAQRRSDRGQAWYRSAVHGYRIRASKTQWNQRSFNFTFSVQERRGSAFKPWWSRRFRTAIG